MVRLLPADLVSVLFLLLQMDSAKAAYCGTDAIPYRLEVLASGALSLGCGVPSCFGGEEGGANAYQHKSSEFIQNDETDNGIDGFIRDGDNQRPHPRYPTAPRQRACCTYYGMEHSVLITSAEIGEKESIVGGEFSTKGRQTDFDVITDVRKISSGGQVKYQVTFSRMPCVPDPPLHNDGSSQQNIGLLQNSVDPGVEENIDKIELADASRGGFGGGQGGFGGGQGFGAGQGGFGAGQGQGGSGFGVAAAQQAEAVVVAPPAPAPLPPVAVVNNNPLAVIAAGLANGQTCFSADTLLTTKSGGKRMDQLRIGDEILTTADYHWQEAFFVPVVSFVHRLPNTRTKFLRIETADGSFVKITPQHLIMVSREEETSGEFILARDVKLGDRFRRISENKFLSATVTNVTVVEEIGAYAPMTSNGVIIVNDLVASCHCVTKARSLQHSFYHFMRKIESLFSPLFGTDANDQGEGFVDVPTCTWKILNILEYILPNFQIISS